MATADLSRTAQLETMIRLGQSALEGIEAPGAEFVSSAGSFSGRNGYDPAFLSGWDIAMPLGVGPAEQDMRALRRGGTGVELAYRNFSVIMSASRRLPMVTAANIDGSEARRVDRGDRWSFDGRLDEADQFGEDLYANNPLDRGHMVRRLDPVWGPLELARQANDDTFHFTNACPQMAGVNQRTWLGLEDYILNNARVDRMRVTVFTGPFFSDEDLIHHSGARIPLAFWKVVAIVTDDGRPSATAYMVSQAKELEDLEFVFAGYKTYQISIRQVLERTNVGFDPLIEYDGFSQFESARGVSLVEPLENLDQIRI